MHNDDIELEPLVGPSRIHDRAGVETQAPAQGHYYSHNQVRDHARVHFGDVYNYRNTDSSEQNVLDWLTSLNPSESHSQACQKYQKGTLAWFFKNIRFEEWSDGLEGLTPRTLWCRGTIGAGKTVLAGQILRHIQDARVCRGYLAVVYCRYPEQKLQTLENILGSIIAQLSQRDESGFEIPPYIQAARESQSRFWTQRPTIHQLSDWLRRRLDTGRPAYIIIDALDELETSCRQKLLRILHSLPHVSLKVLVTSRDLPEIGAELLDTWSITVRASKRDLTTLIGARLRDAAFMSGSVEQAEAFADAESQILSKIIALAENTFLLASIYLDRIVTCTKIADITHHLTTLPLTLDAHYDEAWERCTGGSDVLRSHRARLILMWMSGVRHILATKTLREALSLSGYHSGQGDITDEEIVSSCAGFLQVVQSSAPNPYRLIVYRNGEEITSTRPPWSNDLAEKWRTWIGGSNEAHKEVFFTDTTIRFAHPSAFTYLVQRQKILFPQSNSIITSACLLALSPNEVLCALPLFSTCFLEVPSLIYSMFALYGITWKNSAGKAATWRDVGLSTWLAVSFLVMVIAFVAQFAFHIFSGERLPATAPSMAEYGAIFMEGHAIRSSSSVRLKACLIIGRGSLLYCGLVLLWAWPVAFKGIVSTITSVPLSLDISKIAILIVWNLCTAVSSSGIVAVAVSTPGRRSTVIRFWLFLYLVFLRCVALLFFVKAKR